MINKIIEKFKSRTVLKYLFWKLGITKIKAKVFKILNTELRRWFADKGDERLRFDYDIKDDGLILELGAYTGEDLDRFINNYDCKIIAFEPSKSLFQELQEKYSSSKAEILNFGLYDTNSEYFLIEKNDGSFIKEKVNEKSDKYEKVILKKLSDFITQRDLDFISLINMNIEGSEYRVLKDLIESGSIKNINHLQIQFHRNSFFYFINRYFLIKKLIKTHNLKWRYKYVWERWDLKQ